MARTVKLGDLWFDAWVDDYLLIVQVVNVRCVSNEQYFDCWCLEQSRMIKRRMDGDCTLLMRVTKCAP